MVYDLLYLTLYKVVGLLCPAQFSETTEKLYLTLYSKVIFLEGEMMTYVDKIDSDEIVIS